MDSSTSHESLGVSGHVEQTSLELRQLVVEMTKALHRLRSVHPNLPVTYASVRSSRGRVNISLVFPISTRRPR
jgi:hypothetical protein